MKVSSVSLPESVIDMARFDPCDVVKDLLKVPLKTLYKAKFEFPPVEPSDAYDFDLNSRRLISNARSNSFLPK